MTLSDKERLSILEKQVLILENELKAWKQKEHVAEVLNAERAERTSKARNNLSELTRVFLY